MANTKLANSKTKPEGGDNISNVRLNAKRVIKINPGFSMPAVKVQEMHASDKEYHCCMCGKSYSTQKYNFVSGGSSFLWKGNNGYTPFCKNCCGTLMSILVDFYNGNEEHALRHICQMFDWYYNDDASAMTMRQATSTPQRAVIYPGKANAIQVARKGTTFLDTLRDDYNNTSVVVDYEDESEEINFADDDFELTKDVIRRWGKGYSLDQYMFLEEEYKDWCAKNVCNTKTQEELFKNIALAQLNIRIAQQSGGKVTDAVKSLQELMNSANILPKQTADNILADTQTFGTLLRKYEETNPVPEPDERWKDVDGIRKYMNTWFRGGLAKALNVHHDNMNLYNEAVAEYERYTVKPNAAVSEDVGDSASIFDTQGDESRE